MPQFLQQLHMRLHSPHLTTLAKVLVYGFGLLFLMLAAPLLFIGIAGLFASEASSAGIIILIGLIYTIVSYCLFLQKNIHMVRFGALVLVPVAWLAPVIWKSTVFGFIIFVLGHGFCALLFAVSWWREVREAFS